MGTFREIGHLEYLGEMATHTLGNGYPILSILPTGMKRPLPNLQPEGCSPIPTLTELLVACGDDISHIKRWGGGWWAVSHSRLDKNGNNFERSGKTPEEAVAMLWLCLHSLT